MEEFLKIFTEQGEKLNLWQGAGRGLLIFLITIVIVRLGKRKFLGKNSAIDIILAIMIGSLASRSITGSARLIPTIIIIALLVATHWFLSFISIKSSKIASFLEGSGIGLVKEGKIDEQALKQQLFRKEDLIEAARLRGNIATLEKIKEAYLESNGSISIIKKDS